MIRLRTALTLSLVFFGSLMLAACAALSAPPALDLATLAGTWEGTYTLVAPEGSNERTELPTSLTVTLQSGGGVGGPAEATFVFLYRQPDGSTATEEVLLRYFPNESLLEFSGNWAITEASADYQAGQLRLVFTGTGQDGDREALIRQTLERQGAALTLRKEVRYEPSDKYVVRSEYQLRRAN